MMLVLTILIAVGFAASAAFVLLYSTRSPGWYRGAVGQNLMAMAAVLAALLGMWLVARACGPLPLWVWLHGIGALDAVLIWRVVILWRLQRGRKP